MELELKVLLLFEIPKALHTKVKKKLKIKNQKLLLWTVIFQRFSRQTFAKMVKIIEKHQSIRITSATLIDVIQTNG